MGPLFEVAYAYTSLCVRSCKFQGERGEEERWRRIRLLDTHIGYQCITTIHTVVSIYEYFELRNDI